MEDKDKKDIGDKVEIITADDVAEYIKILSHRKWISKFPKSFINLLNDNYDAAFKAVKYAPAIYFHLNDIFQEDKYFLKAAINSYINHGKFYDFMYYKNQITKK